MTRDGRRQRGRGDGGDCTGLGRWLHATMRAERGDPMRTHRAIVVVAAAVVAVVWSMAAIGPAGGRVGPDTCALPSIRRERAGTGALASAGEASSYDD